MYSVCGKKVPVAPVSRIRGVVLLVGGPTNVEVRFDTTDFTIGLLATV